MGSPGVSVEHFLCQSPQAGILGVRDEELQVGGQQQALQQANGTSWSSRQQKHCCPCSEGVFRRGVLL